MQCYYHPENEAVATCSNCGKATCEICSVDVEGRLLCQTCLASGNLTTYQPRAQVAKPNNPLAIASLILGILGLCGGLPFSIGAWVTGHLARKQILEAQSDQESLQLANIGRVLGITITAIYGVLIVCYLLFIGVTFGGAFLVALFEQNPF